jgi:HD-like signal output (HDOD) protein
VRQERGSLLSRYESSPFLQKALSAVENLPAVTQRFIGLSLSDSTSSAEITAFIKNNPSLAMEVLKVVNSSFHGLRNKVCDINYAVLYLGLSQIFQIVISAGLQGMGGKSSRLSHITSHSVIISNVAGLLSAAGERRASPIVATIGILHDVGEIFRILIKERHEELDILIDHLSGPKLGAMLLAKWGIPEPIHKAVEHSEQSRYSLPEEIEEGLRHYVACLHVSHRVCEFVNEEGPPTDPLTQAYLSFLGFGDMTLEHLVRLFIVPELRASTNKLPIEVQVFFSI